MIQPTQAEIGRRVIYDPRPVLKHTLRGRIVGVGEHFVAVLFDGHEHPLRVISNLQWAGPSPAETDEPTPARERRSRGAPSNPSEAA